MLLCCDVIKIVKAKSKELRIRKNLDTRRTMTQRSRSSGNFSMIDHNHGRSSSYFYERNSVSKKARVTEIVARNEAVSAVKPRVTRVGLQDHHNHNLSKSTIL